MPPMGIVLGKVYDIIEIQEQYALSVDEIKIMFTPVGGEWIEERHISDKPDVKVIKRNLDK